MLVLEDSQRLIYLLVTHLLESWKSERTRNQAGRSPFETEFLLPDSPVFSEEEMPERLSNPCDFSVTLPRVDANAQESVDEGSLKVV